MSSQAYQMTMQRIDTVTALPKWMDDANGVMGHSSINIGDTVFRLDAETIETMNGYRIPLNERLTKFAGYDTYR